MARSESRRTPVERSQTAVGRHPSNLNGLEQLAKEEWTKIILSSAFFLCGIVSVVLFQCKKKNEHMSTKTFATATIF